MDKLFGSFIVILLVIELGTWNMAIHGAMGTAHASESTRAHASESTRAHASESTRAHASESTRARASETTRIHDGARLVEYDGYIMSVDRSNHFILMNEVKFIIGEFQAGNAAWATRMESSKGRMVDIGYFSIGQLVSIRGFAVSESEIFAVSIKTDAGYLRKNQQRIDKLERLRF